MFLLLLLLLFLLLLLLLILHMLLHMLLQVICMPNTNQPLPPNFAALMELQRDKDYLRLVIMTLSNLLQVTLEDSSTSKSCNKLPHPYYLPLDHRPGVPHRPGVALLVREQDPLLPAGQSHGPPA